MRLSKRRVGARYLVLALPVAVGAAISIGPGLELKRTLGEPGLFLPPTFGLVVGLGLAFVVGVVGLALSLRFRRVGLAIAAVALGVLSGYGGAFALGQGYRQPTAGQVTITLQQPGLTLTGSAECAWVRDTIAYVNANQLALPGGRTAQVNLGTGTDPNGIPGPALVFLVTADPATGGMGGQYELHRTVDPGAGIPESTSGADLPPSSITSVAIAGDGGSGSFLFSGLNLGPAPLDNIPAAWPRSMAGSISWSCHP